MSLPSRFWKPRRATPAVRRAASKAARTRFRPQVESLEGRLVPALVPLTVTFTGIQQLDNPDGFPDGDGDYYVIVRIKDAVMQNPVQFDNEAHAIQDDVFNPSAVDPVNWRFTQSVENTGPVEVFIALYDEDDFLRFGDDEMDINPAGERLGVALTVDPLTGRWTGDVPFARAAEGGGGDESERARLNFAIDVGNNADTDGDGLLDVWELRGINVDGAGPVDLTLPGANPYHKDLYVEVDAMTGLVPQAGALSDVVAAFASAPNALVNNPDGQDGVSLHVQLDETNIPNATWPTLDANGWPTAFDAIKANADPGVAGGFGTVAERGDPNAANVRAAKRLAYRYCIFANRYGTTTSSGQAELPGNDFYVTLGGFGTPGGTRDQQAGTFMHELGHTLGLGHGGSIAPLSGTLTSGSAVVTGVNTSQLFAGMGVSGIGIPFDTSIVSVDSATQVTLDRTASASGAQALFFRDDTNRKPNYHSVMSYTWQFRFPAGTAGSAQSAFNASWQLDYSRDDFPDLDENNLPAGIGGHAGHTVGIRPVLSGSTLVGYTRFETENGTVNWGGDAHATQPGVQLDVNGNNTRGVLRGYEDWSHLVYGFRNTSDFADGVHASAEPNELTRESAEIADGLLFYAAPQGNGPDSLTLRRNGADLEIFDNNTQTVVASRPAAATSVVWVLGAEGEDDTLTVAFAGGNPIPSHGVRFDGGAGGADRLAFAGPLPGNPAYTPDADGQPANGTLHLGDSLLTFTGLEFVNAVAPDVTGVRLSAAAVNEDGTVTLTGEFLDPGSLSSHRVAVNWGDGVSDAPVSLAVGARSFTLTHRYRDDNPTGTPSDVNTITVTVTDNDNLADTATTSVRVDNVAPRLANVVVTPEIDENGVVTLSGDILDPGTQDTFTLVVDWGEGAPQSFSYPAGTTRFSETHQYLDDNPTGTPQDAYAIGLTLTDDDTGEATAAASTLVKNVAPVFTALGTSSTSAGPAREGEPVTISGTFADVGTLDTHTVTVDWGDGTVAPAALSEAGGSGSFSAQHAYQFGGIYPVLVTLRDDDTGEVSRVKAVFVTGVGVHVVGGLTSLQVVGTIGADHVTIHQVGRDRIRVHADFLDEAKRTLPLAGLDVMQVVVLAGDDHVSVAGSVDLPAVLDGGDGADHLNGSNAGGVVIGGGGHDHLNGGKARDIVIGGSGADRLVAGAGDDLLIGGLTLYDSGADDDKLANDLNLLRLRQEWNSGRPYAERVANVRGGVGPVLGGTGLRLHKGTTVLDDLDPDVLTGSAGVDWFFFDPLLDSPNGDHGGEETN